MSWGSSSSNDKHERARPTRRFPCSSPTADDVQHCISVLSNPGRNAEMHMAHLSIQRNDAVESAEDCRRKYIAQCLFRKLARENRSLCSRYDNGPFRLFCDDFRPTSVLANSLDGFKVVGVIGWEFTYAAPAEFVYSLLAWLLLERPEFWESGLDDWT